MNVNPISTINCCKKAVRNAGFALVAGLSLVACNQVPNNVKASFQDKPSSEYDQFVAQSKAQKLDNRKLQAKLDSLSFRDFLSVAGVENNKKIVSNFETKASFNINFMDEHLLPKWLKELLPEDEYKKVYKESDSFKNIEKEYFSDAMKLQHKYDSVTYRRLFESYGLLNEENIQEFNKIVNKTNPNQNVDVFVDRR